MSDESTPPPPPASPPPPPPDGPSPSTAPPAPPSPGPAPGAPPPPPPSGLAASSKGPNPHLPPLPTADPSPAPAPSAPDARSSPAPQAAPADDLDDLLAQIVADDTEPVPANVTPTDTAPTDSGHANTTSPDTGASPSTAPTDASTRGAAPTVESDGGLAFDPVIAGIGPRALGLAIDSLVMTLLLVPGIVIAVVGAPVIGVLVAIVGFLVATLLYARAISTRQQWIGNRVAGTRVVNVRNGTAIDTAHAATRFVARQLISPILLFGFLMAFATPQRRAFHDQLAGTIVTRRPLETWTAEGADGGRPA